MSKEARADDCESFAKAASGSERYSTAPRDAAESEKAQSKADDGESLAKATSGER